MSNLLSLPQYLYETTLSQMKTINKLVQPDLFMTDYSLFIVRNFLSTSRYFSKYLNRNISLLRSYARLRMLHYFIQVRPNVLQFETCALIALFVIMSQSYSYTY